VDEEGQNHNVVKSAENDAPFNQGGYMTVELIKYQRVMHSD